MHAFAQVPGTKTAQRLPQSTSQTVLSTFLIHIHGIIHGEVSNIYASGPIQQPSDQDIIYSFDRANLFFEVFKTIFIVFG